MRRTDPLILGAGPAGCAAAIALARGGASPVLLDRGEIVGDPLCGGFISWSTVAQLERLGVSPAALGAHAIGELAVFAGGREFVAPLPSPACALSRHVLDSALRARAVAAGVRLEYDTVRAIEAGQAVGQHRSWAGAGLFLATGKHDVRGLSRPRQGADPALGLRLRLTPNPQRNRLLDGRIELHLLRGGYAGLVVQEDGSANLCLALRKSRLTEEGGDPLRLISGLAAVSPALARRLGDHWHSAVPDAIGAVPYGWLARSTEPGIFRLGDQAAVIPSLAGEGIGIALASGSLAAAHWLRDGQAGAEAYQAQFARRAEPALRTARLIAAAAERPLLARLALALAPLARLAVPLLMDASRIKVSGPLA